MAQVLCLVMHVLKCFWVDVVMTIVHLINQMSICIIDYQTHLRMLLLLSWFYHISLALNIYPKVFSCVMFMCTNYIKINLTLMPSNVFLGYSNSQKGYKFFNSLTWVNTICLWMFNLVSGCLIFMMISLLFLFRGRLVVRKRNNYGCMKRKRRGSVQLLWARESLTALNLLVTKLNERDKLAWVFDKYYSKRNVIFNFDISLNDTVMSLKDSFGIDHATQISIEILDF